MYNLTIRSVDGAGRLYRIIKEGVLNGKRIFEAYL